jgi:hypothetical protein
MGIERFVVTDIDMERMTVYMQPAAQMRPAGCIRANSAGGAL